MHLCRGCISEDAKMMFLFIMGTGNNYINGFSDFVALQYFYITFVLGGSNNGKEIHKFHNC